MSEVDDLKKAIADDARGYTDAELGRLSRDLDLLAEMLLDLHLLSRSGHQKGIVFDT